MEVVGVVVPSAADWAILPGQLLRVQANNFQAGNAMDAQVPSVACPNHLAISQEKK